MDEINLDRLFNKIRDQRVVLFLGAGASISAGIPSGYEMAKILYDDIEKDIKEGEFKKIIKSEIKNLPKFCTLYNHFVKDKGKLYSKVRSLVEKDFSDKELEPYKNIKHIPQIETILTTNYDNLVETIYGKENIDVIRSDNDYNLSKHNRDKVKLYKLHSDFNNIDNIILTEQDYNDFDLYNVKDRLMWDTIKLIMANNTLVFIGYSLDDPNIKFILNKVVKHLDTFKNENFLIVPEKIKYRDQELQDLNITQIEMTAEEFIDKLYKKICDTIVSDIEDGRISHKKGNKLLKHKNVILPVQTDDKSGEVRYSHLKTYDSKGRGNLKIRCLNDKENVIPIEDLHSNIKLDGIKLNSDSIVSVESYLNGIRAMRWENSDDSKLEVMIKPSAIEEKDVILKMLNFTEKMKMKIYVTGNLINILLKNKLLDIKITENMELYENSEDQLIHNYKRVKSKLDCKIPEGLSIDDEYYSLQLIRGILTSEFEIFSLPDKTKLFSYKLHDDEYKSTNLINLKTYVNNRLNIIKMLKNIGDKISTRFEVVPVNISNEQTKFIRFLNDVLENKIENIYIKVISELKPIIEINKKLEKRYTYKKRIFKDSFDYILLGKRIKLPKLEYVVHNPIILPIPGYNNSYRIYSKTNNYYINSID